MGLELLAGKSDPRRWDAYPIRRVPIAGCVQPFPCQFPTLGSHLDFPLWTLLTTNTFRRQFTRQQGLKCAQLLRPTPEAAVCRLYRPLPAGLRSTPQDHHAVQVRFPVTAGGNEAISTQSFSFMVGALIPPAQPGGQGHYPFIGCLGWGHSPVRRDRRLALKKSQALLLCRVKKAELSGGRAKEK
jgi:hypothetical protein